MKRWLIPGVVLVLAITTLGLVTAVWRGAGAPSQRVTPQPAASTAIVRTDLADSVERDGTVGYGVEHTLTGRKTGTVTWLPAPGATVDRGGTLYTVDAQPVVLFLGSTPLYRTLDKVGLTGPDVKVVNANLAALGYREAGHSGDEYTAATQTAVKSWQRRLGVPATGGIDAGDVVVLPQAVRVSSVKVDVGVRADQDLFTVTGRKTVATVPVSAADAPTLHIGEKVTVEFHDATVVPGTVSDIRPCTDDTGKPAFTAIVTTARAVPATGAVRVRFTTQTHQGVLAVPVGALLAQRSGGYAVQVVDGTGTSLVPVHLGLFDQGMVEISGTGIREREMVVVTS